MTRVHAPGSVDRVVLVNAARGGIVDEGALYDALKTGEIDYESLQAGGQYGVLNMDAQGNYNYVRDGANQALNRLVGYLLRQGVHVRIYAPCVKEPAFEPTGDPALLSDGQLLAGRIAGAAEIGERTHIALRILRQHPIGRWLADMNGTLYVRRDHRRGLVGHRCREGAEAARDRLRLLRGV